jgi:hypothetical protein
MEERYRHIILPKIWQQRKDWIDDEIEKAEVQDAMSNYALVLFQDMKLAYCAGAWKIIRFDLTAKEQIPINFFFRLKTSFTQKIRKRR